MLCHKGKSALGVESGIVKTHSQAKHIQYVSILEVLHGALHPKAHNNGLGKKKKHDRYYYLQSASNPDQTSSWSVAHTWS